MSRVTPLRTGGKAAPKNHSPPRDASAGGSGADKPEDAAAAAAAGDTALRQRRRSGGSGSGHDDSGKAQAPSHWNTLRELADNKVLVQSLLRASKAAHTNAADAARNELSVPKRLVLNACTYALRVPAVLADQPKVMAAAGVVDRGIGWVYDRARSTVSGLEAEGERVAMESAKQFDAAVSATPAKAEMTPVVAAGAGGANNGKPNGVRGLVHAAVAVMVYLSVSLARGVVRAVREPHAALSAVKTAAANIVSGEQWKLRANALIDAWRRVWTVFRARNGGLKAADAEPGASMRAAARDLMCTVLLVLMPWREMPRPAQSAH